MQMQSEWKGNETIFRGYAYGDGKQPLEAASVIHPWNTVTKDENFGGYLWHDFVDISFDTEKDTEAFQKIAEAQNLQYMGLRSDKGLHVYLKKGSFRWEKKHYTAVPLACGLTADITAGENGYIPLKVHGKPRFPPVHDVPDQKGYDPVPFWMWPVNAKQEEYRNLAGMKAGDGRNSTLYGYELILQAAGLSKEEVKDTIRIINGYVLDDPLPEDELNTVTRDEALQKPSFFEGSRFLHNVLGDYLIRNNNVINADGTLHIYRDGMYQFGTKELEAEIIKQIPAIKTNQRTEVLKYLQVMAPDRTASSPELIAFRNGVLNIRTDELLPFSPEYVITNRIPWDYNPYAESPALEALLNRISCDDPEIRALLEECIGYCFYRENSLHKFFILTGSGSNGKSTFLKILQKVLGADNVSAIDLRDIGGKFETVGLYKKLANIGDDIADGYIEDSSVFKKVASGDRISAQFKFQDAFSFVPYAKMIFSANDVPRIRDKTGAVQRRMIIVPFNAHFTENDPSFDPDILHKVSDQASMECCIRLGMEGLKRLYRTKRFTKSSKVEEQMEEYREINNPVLGFIKDNEESYFFRYPLNEIYLRYTVFCSQNGNKSESKIQFGKELRELLKAETYLKKLNGKTERYYRKR